MMMRQDWAGERVLYGRRMFHFDSCIQLAACAAPSYDKPKDGDGRASVGGAHSKRTVAEEFQPATKSLGDVGVTYSKRQLPQEEGTLSQRQVFAR